MRIHSTSQRFWSSPFLPQLLLGGVRLRPQYAATLVQFSPLNCMRIVLNIAHSVENKFNCKKNFCFFSPYCTAAQNASTQWHGQLAPTSQPSKCCYVVCVKLSNIAKHLSTGCFINKTKIILNCEEIT